MAPDKSLAAEIEAGRIAYETRFEGFTLGPRGVSDAWKDLTPTAKAIWARVEERVLAAYAAPTPSTSTTARGRDGIE